MQLMSINLYHLYEKVTWKLQIRILFYMHRPKYEACLMVKTSYWKSVYWTDAVLRCRYSYGQLLKSDDLKLGSRSGGAGSGGSCLAA